jgi:hypothetical protein
MDDIKCMRELVPSCGATLVEAMEREARRWRIIEQVSVAVIRCVFHNPGPSKREFRLDGEPFEPLESTVNKLRRPPAEKNAKGTTLPEMVSPMRVD